MLYGNAEITIEEAVDAWKEHSGEEYSRPYPAKRQECSSRSGRREASDGKLTRWLSMHLIYVCEHKIAQPTVFIPVFPGTNCEYDSTKAFERAGAKVITKVFKQL